MDKKVQIIALILLLASISAAQSRHAPGSRAPQPPPKKELIAIAPTPRVDVRGKLEGQTYTNAYLRFNLILPEGWQPQDMEVQQLVMDKALRAATKEDSPAEQAASRESMERTTMLLIAIKPDELRNSIIVVMAEDIAPLLNVRTPRQYLAQMRLSMGKDSALVVSETRVEQINGVEYGVVDAGPPDPQTGAMKRVAQQYYVTIRRNHAVVFILTPQSFERMQECKDVLSAVKYQ